MRNTRRIFAALIFGSLLAMLISGAAMAQTAPVFATLDLEKAFDGYDKKVQLEKNLSDDYAKVRQWFEIRGENKLLNTTEFTELLNLLTKAATTDAEKKRIEELNALSRQRESEFTSLQQKTSPTETEAARLRELQASLNAVDAAIREEDKKRAEELGAKRVELSQQVMKDIDATIAEVAKEKGITLVFNKSAGEPGVVLYSNLDITDEVLAKLNKK